MYCVRNQISISVFLLGLLFSETTKVLKKRVTNLSHYCYNKIITRSLGIMSFFHTVPRVALNPGKASKEVPYLSNNFYSQRPPVLNVSFLLQIFESPVYVNLKLFISLLLS